MSTVTSTEIDTAVAVPVLTPTVAATDTQHVQRKMLRDDGTLEDLSRFQGKEKRSAPKALQHLSRIRERRCSLASSQQLRH